MKRNTAFKILNPIIGVLLAVQICSGLFADSLLHDAFEILHEANGITLAILIVLHIAMNWNWVTANFFKKAKKA